MEHPTFLLFAEEAAVSAKDIMVVLNPIIVAVIGGFWVWWRERRKVGTGVHLTETEIRKADADLLVLNATKFDEFLQKLYDAKMLAIKSEEELSDCRRELKDCEEEKGDCKEFRARVVDFFMRAQAALQAYVDDPFLREFEDLRMSMKPKVILIDETLQDPEQV